MDVDRLRRFCLSLPHTTEQIQWEDHLVFKVGGKMYAVASLEPAPVWLMLKSTPEEFAELVEQPGIIPAPYLARARWFSLVSPDAAPRSEIERLVRRSYDLVFANLPRKIQASLASAKPRKSRKPNRSPRRRASSH